MIYQLCKRLIQMGKIEGLIEKIDVFYLANRITKEEYEELIQLIGGNNND
jgi:hypothetical protein